ncbi:MAG: alpha-L-rhamnosidase N-terminal domain-containing protein [Fimbriimonadia bacterium]
MSEDGFRWQACWIWSDHEEPQWNQWLCFRKSFDLQNPASDAKLRITADSRYRVWLNGKLLGQGPVRAWPDDYRYDIYDVGHLLHTGRNAISVLVHEFGVGNFQYIPSRGGLLAQIDGPDGTILASDQTWRVREFAAYSRETLRISCQQGWAEAYDAALATDSWTSAEFDHSFWDRATLIGPVGAPPWSRISPRDVPFLTEEPLTPIAVREARIVRAPRTVWSVSLRRNLLPGYRASNLREMSGLLVTVAESTTGQPIEMEMRGVGSEPGALTVNGEQVKQVPSRLPAWAGSRRYRASLAQGPNLFIWNLSGEHHEWRMQTVLEAGRSMGVRAPNVPGAEFVTIALSKTDLRYDKLLRCRDVEDFNALAAPMTQAVTALDVHHNCVTADVAYAEEVRALDRMVYEGLVRGSGTTIEPSGGGDTEIVLEFEKLTIGYWEIDVEAEEGTTIDILGFEAYQEGVRDLPWDMENTLRYRCRGGRQTFRSFVRRGARYLIVTVRNHSLPVKLHAVRIIQATYPTEPVGAFHCSDDTLNRVWEMCAHTTRMCMEDTFTDCPTYEQTFWVGDSRPEALAAYYCFGAYDLSARCLRLAARSLKRSKLVESQCPSAWQNIIPNWSFLWALACEDYYMHTGDRGLIQELLPALVKQAQNAKAMLNAEGLFAIKAWNLTDWAPMDQPNEGVVTPQNLLLAGSWRSLSRLLRSFGNETEASQWDGAADVLIDAIISNLWSEEKRAYVDCLKADGSLSNVVSQQTQILALRYRAARKDRAILLHDALTNPPPGMVRVGTPFFAFFWLEMLAEMGWTEDMLNVIRDKWGFMLDCGATTCWEVFPSFYESGRWTRSHCHAWGAGPAYFLGTHVLGVRPLEPGFARVSIAPSVRGLSWAEGRVPTPHGPIGVRWSLTEDGMELEAELPEGVVGVVEAPLGYLLSSKPAELKAGRHSLRLPRAEP